MVKLPPIEKVFEAWTAIVDGRITFYDHHAEVASSDGDKEYTVKFDGNKYSSDDNATFWRGYASYPVLAVLMMQGRLPFDKEEARRWSNINWKEINTHFKNNYAQAVQDVAYNRNIDLTASYQAAENVMTALKQLNIEIKRKI